VNQFSFQEMELPEEADEFIAAVRALRRTAAASSRIAGAGISQQIRQSIRGRMLNAIDYQNFFRGLPRFYFQPQLLLKSFDERQIQDVGRRQRVGGVGWQLQRVGNGLQIDVVFSGLGPFLLDRLSPARSGRRIISF
jgi:hypothetical protein